MLLSRMRTRNERPNYIALPMACQSVLREGGKRGFGLSLGMFWDKMTEVRGNPEVIMPPRSRKVEKLGITLEKMLARRGFASKLQEYRLFGQWERAVGAVIARHAQPSAIRAKKLTVTVDSSAWMQQLSFLRPELINKVNACLKEEAVESITLRIGELNLPAAPRQEHRPPAGSLDTAELRKVEEYVAAIADPEVRESFRRLIAKDLLSKKQAAKRSS